MELETDKALGMSPIDLFKCYIPDRLVIDPSLNQRPLGYNPVFIPVIGLKVFMLLPFII